jgi:hypothetical protein
VKAGAAALAAVYLAFHWYFAASLQVGCSCHLSYLVACDALDSVGFQGRVACLGSRLEEH